MRKGIASEAFEETHNIENALVGKLNVCSRRDHFIKSNSFIFLLRQKGRMIHRVLARLSFNF